MQSEDSLCLVGKGRQELKRFEELLPGCRLDLGGGCAFDEFRADDLDLAAHPIIIAPPGALRLPDVVQKDVAACGKKVGERIFNGGARRHGGDSYPKIMQQILGRIVRSQA